jgi:hypothetical protein
MRGAGRLRSEESVNRKAERVGSCRIHVLAFCFFLSFVFVPTTTITITESRSKASSKQSKQRIGIRY